MVLKTIKSYVNSNNNATVICPACNAAKHISATPYLHKKHIMRVSCHCGEKFELKLDFRRHYRKSVNLPGTYTITTPKKIGGGIIHIQNISQSGLGFTISGRHHMEIGLEIAIEFNLTNRTMNHIKKDATVRTVQNNYIGCEFFTNTPDDRVLGFYLRP